MTANFTPGPWLVSDLPTAQRYIRAHGDGGAPSVALVLARANVPDERLAADARLIAAAPELLEALRGVLDSLAWHADRHGNVGMDAQRRLDARAVIAKATGEA
jgi:hypothetical protein